MVNTANPRTFEDSLVRHCAPTLAGLKPGSIFCVKPSAPDIIRRKVRQWNRQLNPFGLSVRILLERPAYALTIVYVYRKKQLEARLMCTDCQCFLKQHGYAKTDLDSLLMQLAHRLQTQSDFPHEIGVFLGYPLRDVIGFIENRGQNFTCCGLWKSYSDPAEIQACFDCYRTCIHTYVELFEKGVPIEKLAVPA